MNVGSPHQRHPLHRRPHPAQPSCPPPRSFVFHPQRPMPMAHPPLLRYCWTWVFPLASHLPRALGGKRHVEELSHPHQEYHARLPAPLEPLGHHPWASSADLGPHHSVAVLTHGALCQLGHGLHPCPLHSLHPDGHLGLYSRTQILSGTPHLPTPSGEAPRTAGHRPKT